MFVLDYVSFGAWTLCIEAAFSSCFDLWIWLFGMEAETCDWKGLIFIIKFTQQPAVLLDYLFYNIQLFCLFLSPGQVKSKDVWFEV